MKPFIFALLLVTAGSNLHAQTFGEGMTTPSAEDLNKLLAGNVYTVERSDGNHWRLEFKSNGYYFFNNVQGYSDSGEWKTEEGKLCALPRKTPAACSEARLSNGVLTLRRANGEIIIYKRKE